MFLEKYLNEIKFTGKSEANLGTLSKLHELHTLRFPFENLTPFLHQEVKLDDLSLEEKFLKDGRAGYCFEQNLFFARAIKDIGFNVTGLGARVLWNQPEDLITRRSHMLLMIDLDSKKYLCDVGFGGLTLTTPLLFEIGRPQNTTHEQFKIETIQSDFKLQASVAGEWKTLYRFDLQEQQLIDYEVANYYLYTHPSSIFRNNLIAAKPFTGGRIALNNDTLSVYEKGELKERRKLNSPEEIRNALSEKFKIKLPDHPELNNRLKSIIQLIA